MDQLTVRGFDPELERAIRETAAEYDVSLSRAALALMRRGAGQDCAQTGLGRVGHTLDEFFGIWSDNEGREFREAIKYFERIDDEMWR